jgi:hypothetical protein
MRSAIPPHGSVLRRFATLLLVKAEHLFISRLRQIQARPDGKFAPQCAVALRIACRLCRRLADSGVEPGRFGMFFTINSI